MNNKRHFIFSVLALLSMVGLLVSCGGGGGGSSGGSSSSGSGTAIGQFIKSIIPAGASGHWYLFDPNPNGSRYQMLYRASDVQGAGNIDSISFKLAGITAGTTCPNVEVRMAHTSVTSLTDTTFANNVEQGKGSVDIVRAAATLTIPAGAVDDYITVPLDHSFAYNGTDNLIVDVLTNACGSTVIFKGMAPAVAYNPLIWTLNRSSLTGTSFNTLVHTKFNFAGGDNKLDYSGASSALVPFSSTLTRQRSQMLHLAAAVDGSGPITGIGMVTNTTTVAATYTMTIMVGHSTLAALTNTYANNYSDTPVTVANDLTFTVPAGVPAGETIWLPLDSVFNYNGSDNLIIEIAVTAANAATNWRGNAAIGNFQLLWGPTASATGTIYTWGMDTKLRFNGGRVNVVTDAASFSSNMFGPAANGYATLYRASELGSAGTITSIGCRAHIDTVAGSYPSYQLIIGHTAADALTSPADFVSQNVAYSGTYTIPATLKKGDWIDVPLSVPFVYDGKSNLIIWQGSTIANGSNANYCSFSNTATRYISHGKVGAPSTSFGITASRKANISLTIQQ